MAARVNLAWLGLAWLGFGIGTAACSRPGRLPTGLAADPGSADAILVSEVGFEPLLDPDDPGVAWRDAAPSTFERYYAAVRAELGIDREATVAAEIADALLTWTSTDPGRYPAPPPGLASGLTSLAYASYDVLEFELDARTGSPGRIDRLGYVVRDLPPEDVVAAYLASHEPDVRAALGLAAGRRLVLDRSRDFDGHFTEVVYVTYCEDVLVRDDHLFFEVTGPEHPEGAGVLTTLNAVVHPDVTCPYARADLLADVGAISLAAADAGLAAGASGTGSLYLAAAEAPDAHRWLVSLDGQADAWIVDAAAGIVLSRVEPDHVAGTLKTNISLGAAHGTELQEVPYIDLWDTGTWSDYRGRTDGSGTYDLTFSGTGFISVTSPFDAAYDTGGVDWAMNATCTAPDLNWWQEFTPGGEYVWPPSTTPLFDGMGNLIGTPRTAVETYWLLTWQRGVLASYGAEIATDINFLVNGGTASFGCAGTSSCRHSFNDVCCTNQEVFLRFHEGSHCHQACENDSSATTCDRYPEPGSEAKYDRVRSSYKEGTADFFGALFEDFAYQYYASTSCGFALSTYKPDHYFIDYTSTMDTWGLQEGDIPSGASCFYDTDAACGGWRCGDPSDCLWTCAAPSPAACPGTGATCPAGLCVYPCSLPTDCPALGPSPACSAGFCSWTCYWDADCSAGGTTTARCGPAIGTAEICYPSCVTNADCGPPAFTDPSLYCACNSFSGGTPLKRCFNGIGYQNGSLFSNVHRGVSLSRSGTFLTNLYVDTSGNMSADMEYTLGTNSFYARMTGTANVGGKFEVSSAFKRTFLSAYTWADDYTSVVDNAPHFEVWAEDFTNHTVTSGGPAGLGTAAISYAWDYDWFLFRVAPGDAYTFGTTSVTGINSCLYLYKFPAGGGAPVLVASATDCAAPAESSITYTIPTGETAKWFAIRVQSTNGLTGTYNLNVARPAGGDGYGDAFEDAFPLVVRSTLSEPGTINPTGDVDWSKSYVPSVGNSTLTVSLTGLVSWTPHIEIWAGAPGSPPTLVASGNPTPSGGTATLSTGVGGPGETAPDQWFYAAVSKYSGGAPISSYNISIKLVDDANGKEITPDWTSPGSPYTAPFAWGEAVASSLGAASDVDSYNVTLDAYEHLTVDTAGIRGTGDVSIELYAPGLDHFMGLKALWNDDGGAEGGTSGKADHLHFIAPLAGTYRIDVKSSSGTAVDGYRLYLARGPNYGGHPSHPTF